jgi:hypothetical protein
VNKALAATYLGFCAVSFAAVAADNVSFLNPTATSGTPASCPW